MSDYPKLSIVVPTYNRSVFLKACVDSILSQNYPNLEIVITDDNSTDDTEKLCKNYCKKYPFIKYVKNSKYPQGPNGNKNNGLDHCSGEVIGIFDDDDTMAEGALKAMTTKLFEGYDVVMGNCEIVSDRWDNGRFSGAGLDCDGEVNWIDNLCGKILGEFWAIFRKEILGAKRFDTDLYGGEGTLWRGMLKNKKIYYIHKVVRYYRISEGSVTNNTIKNANRVIVNYERDIEYYGEEMKQYCPCYLATIYKGVAYFAKLSSQYIKSFRYVFKSISLCPLYKSNYIILIVLFLPISFIPSLLKVKQYIRQRKGGKKIDK